MNIKKKKSRCNSYLFRNICFIDLKCNNISATHLNNSQLSDEDSFHNFRKNFSLKGIFTNCFQKNKLMSEVKILNISAFCDDPKKLLANKLVFPTFFEINQ